MICPFPVLEPRNCDLGACLLNHLGHGLLVGICWQASRCRCRNQAIFPARELWPLLTTIHGSPGPSITGPRCTRLTHLLAGFHFAQPAPCAPRVCPGHPSPLPGPSPDAPPLGDPARLSQSSFLLANQGPLPTTSPDTHTRSHTCAHTFTHSHGHTLRGTHTQAHICTVTSIIHSHSRICVLCELLSSRSVGATCRGHSCGEELSLEAHFLLRAEPPALCSQARSWARPDERVHAWPGRCPQPGRVLSIIISMSQVSKLVQRRHPTFPNC